MISMLVLYYTTSKKHKYSIIHFCNIHNINISYMSSIGSNCFYGLGGADKSLNLMIKFHEYLNIVDIEERETRREKRFLRRIISRYNGRYSKNSLFVKN